MTTKHTPIPWKYDLAGHGNIRPIKENGRNICYFGKPVTNGEHWEREANAKLIVQAVNSHHALVEALQALLDTYAPNAQHTVDNSLTGESILHPAVRNARAILAKFSKEWSGHPDPSDPDNYWIDDKTGKRVRAALAKAQEVV